MKKQSSSKANYQQDSIENSLSLTSTASTTTSSSSSQSRPSKGSESSRKHSYKPVQSVSLLYTARRFLSRSNPATPDIPIDRSLHHTPSNSMDMPRRTDSPIQMSPRSSISPDRSDCHKPGAHARHSRRISDDYRRYNGTVNHYGRHSNDWLFGGFSLRDTVRDGMDRLRHHAKGG